MGRGVWRWGCEGDREGKYKEGIRGHREGEYQGRGERNGGDGDG